MNIHMKMLQEIERAADSPQFRKRAEQFGAKAAQANLNRSQITGLEAMANSSKVSDVFNYVKLRAARQKGWRYQKVGQELLDYLENDLNRTKEDICQRLEQSTEVSKSVDKQEVYRLLIRQFVAHLAAHYEYASLP